MSLVPIQPSIPMTSHIFNLQDIQIMASVIAKSELFGVKTAEQAFALMLVAQAEGLHPVRAAQDYDIIQGRPAKKAEAMHRDFLRNGGKITWKTLTESEAEAVFSHPQGGEATIQWNLDKAKTAGLFNKDMWKKYPRQMLRSRVISEGIRTIFPLATSGFYVQEEVMDIVTENNSNPFEECKAIADKIKQTMLANHITVEQLEEHVKMVDIQQAISNGNIDFLTKVLEEIKEWSDSLEHN